jgi:hypothetical protein
MAKRKGYTAYLKAQPAQPEPTPIPQKLEGLRLPADGPKTWGQGLKGLWDARNERVREGTKAEADARERGGDYYKDYLTKQTIDTVTNMPVAGVTSFLKPASMAAPNKWGLVSKTGRVPDVEARKMSTQLANRQLDNWLKKNPDILPGQQEQIRNVFGDKPITAGHVRSITDKHWNPAKEKKVAGSSKAIGPESGQGRIYINPDMKKNAAEVFVHEFNHTAQNALLKPEEMARRWKIDPTPFELGSNYTAANKTMPEPAWNRYKAKLKGLADKSATVSHPTGARLIKYK